MVELPGQEARWAGDEQHKAHMKGLFKSTSLDVWQMYKQSLRAIETSYLQGKEEAYNEVMKYLVMLNKNSDFRYVPIKEFISYLESRYKAHREECETRNLTLHRNSHPSQLAGNLHFNRATEEVQAALNNLTRQAQVVAEEQGPLCAV